MILADTSVWVDLFRGEATPPVQRLAWHLDQEAVLIGDLILAEVLQGFASDLHFQRARVLLAPLPTIEIGGEKTALQAARNYRALRSRGITVRGTIDTLIATRCIEDGLTLLHSDRDFEPFEEHLGLRTAI